MKILKILFITFFVYIVAFINIGQAYDFEENVSTNHYWGFSQNESIRYGLSNYNKAIIVKHNGHDVVKLLQPGELIVYCQRINKDTQIYQVLLHISGNAIDGSLINDYLVKTQFL